MKNISGCPDKGECYIIDPRFDAKGEIRPVFSGKEWSGNF
jgi:hypothetical protein